MPRPTWVTVVGIIMIILGCFGIWWAQGIFTLPKVLEAEKQTSPQKQQIQAEMVRQGVAAGTSPQDAAKIVHDIYEKLGNVPAWFGSWCLIMGILQILIRAFYILAGIRLL